MNQIGQRTWLSARASKAFAALTFTLLLGVLSCAAQRVHPVDPSDFPPPWPGWERYRISSLGDVIAAHTEKGDEGRRVTIILQLGVVALRTRQVYTGQFRPLSAPSREAFDTLMKVNKTDPHIQEKLSIYQRELLVKEKGVSYWMPIQEVLVPQLVQEINEGGPVILYATLAGKFGGDWVFLINEFQALPGNGRT